MFLIGVVILITGGVLLGLMLLLMRARRSEEETWRLLAATPTTPIAEVTGPGLVGLQGRVVTSDQGTVVSPVSGRPMVSYRIDICQWFSGARPSGSKLRVVYTERERREFWLDDGSGRRAWISPREASIMLPNVQYCAAPLTGAVLGGTAPTEHPITPQMEAWAMQRTGTTGPYVIDERCIAEGDPLVVLGRASFHDGVLVLRSDPPEHRLLMSTMTEQQIFDHFAEAAYVRKVLLTVSLGATCVGALLIALGIVS